MFTATEVACAISMTAIAIITGKFIHDSTGIDKWTGFSKVWGNWPVYGHTFSVRNAKKFYPILSANGSRVAAVINISNVNVLALCSAEYIKWVLVKGTNTFLGKATRAFPRTSQLLGAHSVLSDLPPAQHKRIRQLLGQSITNEILSQCYPQLSNNARVLLTEMSMQKEIRVYDFSKTFTFNAIAYFMFGSRSVDVERVKRLYPDFAVWFAGLSDFYVPVWMNGPFAKAVAARKQISDVFMAIIAERRLEMVVMDVGDYNDDKVKVLSEENKDGLSKLLDAGGEKKNGDGGGGQDVPLSDAEVLENLFVFVFAGFETTAATISSSVHYFVYEMDETEKNMLVDEVCGNTEDVSSALPTAAAALVSGLPVLDAFVKEVLRIKSPVSTVLRKTNMDVDLGGHFLPKDTVVAAYIGGMGYNQAVFPDPSIFKLSRFLESTAGEKSAQLHSYVPFGAGPRLCLGMALARLEIKIFMTQFITGFVALKGSKASIETNIGLVHMNPC
ncbi:hypothetical protein HK100_000510, partial [Physocladia obscura]